jgi:hypothetical protein
VVVNKAAGLVFSDVRAAEYDLRAVNPNSPGMTDKRTVSELAKIIREAQQTINENLAQLGI